MGFFDKFFYRNKKNELPPEGHGSPNRDVDKKEFPPRPAWKPDLSVDIDLIFDKAKFYTGNKLQLAVFKHGTVAYFSKKVKDIEDSAKSALGKIYISHPDFKPIEMTDGNYLIEYSQPAFTIVFKEECENNWEYIDANHKAGVCTDEVLINGKGEANVFDRTGKICLFGRSKMFMDAQLPVVVKIFNPEQVH